MYDIMTLLLIIIYKNMSNIVVSIEGSGLSFKKEVSLDKAGQIITFLGLNINQDGSGSDSTPQILSLDSVSFNPKTTPREYIQKSVAKTNAQKITALANYLSDIEKVTSFSKQEIKILFGRAGEKNPRNFLRDLKEAKRLGYITEDHQEKDKYILSDKGKEIFSTGFVQEPVRKRTVKNSVKKNKNATPMSESVKNLEISSNMQDFPGYHNLKTKADQILWMLIYCDNKGIESLTPGEVEFLSDKLKGKIAATGFTAHNTRNIKKGYSIKASGPDGKYKIQQSGIEHIKSISNE